MEPTGEWLGTTFDRTVGPGWR